MDSVRILLHGEHVGTLTCLPGVRTDFAFTSTYINNPHRPVLGLWFKNAHGELRTKFGTKQTRLLPFFSGLLPEGALREYLARRAGVNADREYFLLRALGQDLPGAVKAVPNQEIAPDDNRQSDSTLGSMHLVLDPWRFSLAGIQLKFSALREQNGGLTIPAIGIGGDWIVKLPSQRFRGVPENEYSMMTLARLVGIDVPETQLLDIREIGNMPPEFATLGSTAFAIRRFDRCPDGSPVHMEDFAQIFGVYPEEKYDKASYASLARVLAAESTDLHVVEFVRRVVFNTLIGNGDMHMKNWSVVYPDRRHVALAPAYDFVSTLSYLPDKNSALKVCRTKRFDQFTMAELVHLATKARLPEQLVRDTARESVELFHQHWHNLKGDFPCSKTVVDAIERHLPTVPIAGIKPGSISTFVR